MNMRMIFRLVLVFVLFMGALTFVVFNYSWLFSKSVSGEVIEIERLTSAESQNVHAYMVLIQDPFGFMFTASAEDRQWQVVKKGSCVMATLYRYPPWDIERGGGFFNARLRQVYPCPTKEEQTEDTVIESSMENEVEI